MGKSDPPDSQSPQAKSSAKDGALKSLVGVQSLIQLGLFLPAAVVVGWAMGLVLDRWLNQHWINIAGVVAGAVAAFVYIFRIVLTHFKE
jgi:F0F1-type ATP synthase assembly protein I